MERPLLSIIIPALNEERHLAGSIREALKAADASGLACEVIVVDDGSTDRTREVALRLAEHDARIRTIANPRNLGLGAAYKTGLEAALGSYVTWVPADESHPADGLLPAYRAIGSADIIVPCPVNPRVRRPARRVLSGLYTRLVNAMTGHRVPYYNGLSVHRTALLRSIELRTDGFGFQAEAITKLLARGASYRAVDTYITERQLGHSKAFRLRNVLGVARTLFRILRASRRRPGACAPETKAPAQESMQAAPQNRK